MTCLFTHRHMVQLGSRCGDPKQWSCGSPCGRALSCGQHLCKARQGRMVTFGDVFGHGRFWEALTFGRFFFFFARVFGDLLEDGFEGFTNILPLARSTFRCSHRAAKLRCHAGPCPPCNETSLESCYCGKREAWRVAHL